jgi:anti-anti-sigma factor
MALKDTIKLPKRFDYSSSAEFNAEFLELGVGVKTIFLDCSNLDYIDSAGIGLLVMAYKKSQAQSTQLVITNLKQTPKEILHLANLQKLIEFR